MYSHIYLLTFNSVSLLLVLLLFHASILYNRLLPECFSCKLLPLILISILFSRNSIKSSMSHLMNFTENCSKINALIMVMYHLKKLNEFQKLLGKSGEFLEKHCRNLKFPLYTCCKSCAKQGRNTAVNRLPQKCSSIGSSSYFHSEFPFS